MGIQKNIPNIKPGDWTSVRQVIARLASRLGPASEATFAGLTLTGLTASRLVATDTSKGLSSVANLSSWIAGTANEINVADDGDGTVTIGIVDPLIVAKGGTGIDALTDHGILLGSGTGAITPLAAATNGQLPIGSTGADPVLATLTGTANQVVVTNAAGSITLSLPQNIHATASPVFTSVQAGSLIMAEGSITDITGAISFGNENLSTTGNLTVSGDIICGTLTAVGAISGANTYEWDAAYAHSQDSTQAHSDYLINNGDDSTSGKLTASAFITGSNIGIAADEDLLQLTANTLIVNGDVGIGGTPTATLHVINEEDNANVTIFNLEGKRPTPTNNDTMYIYYRMYNDAPASYEYARTTITAEDITEGEEEGSLLFEISREGTLETALKMSSSEIVLNEAGADRDLRIEAFGVPQALFINGADGAVNMAGAVTVGSLVTAGNIGIAADTDLMQLTSNLLTVNGAVTSTTTVQGEQITSTDDITMAGLFTNTPAAGDATVINIDGDTNARSYAGAAENIYSFKRTLSGSDSTMSSMSMTLNTLTYDYDFTGQAGAEDVIRAMFNTLSYTGDFTPSSVFIGNGRVALRGVQCYVDFNPGTITDPATGNLHFKNAGGYFESLNRGDFNLDGAGTCTVHTYGGYFLARENVVITAGTPVLNYYGGYFEATGDANGTSTSYGGYFSGTGSDTNYDIYAANAGSTNYLAGNLFIGTMKSGATQAAAGAAANELWKTASHATLPDNVVMIGV